MIKLREIFADSLPIIEKFAPTIGAAIGGPVGMASGYIIPFLASAFKVDPTNLGALSTAIATNSDPQSVLSELENLHGSWLKSIATNMPNLASAEINLKLQWNPTPIT